MNTNEELTKEFYNTFTTSSKLDIADWWLSKLDAYKAELAKRIEGTKKNIMVTGDAFNWHEKMTNNYNHALSDIINLIKDEEKK